MVDRKQLKEGVRVLIQWNKEQQYEATIHSWIQTENRGIVDYDDGTDSKMTYARIVKIVSVPSPVSSQTSSLSSKKNKRKSSKSTKANYSGAKKMKQEASIVQLSSASSSSSSLSSSKSHQQTHSEKTNVKQEKSCVEGGKDVHILVQVFKDGMWWRAKLLKERTEDHKTVFVDYVDWRGEDNQKVDVKDVHVIDAATFAKMAKKGFKDKHPCMVHNASRQTMQVPVTIKEEHYAEAEYKDDGSSDTTSTSSSARGQRAERRNMGNLHNEEIAEVKVPVVDQFPDVRSLNHLNTFISNNFTNRMLGEFLQQGWACAGFNSLTVGSNILTPNGHRAMIASFTKKCHNKSFAEIKSLISEYNIGGWGAKDGQLIRWLMLSPGDRIMIRLASACEACPISHDMLPSLFNDNGTFKIHKNLQGENNHHKGVYFVGRVTSLPSTESYLDIVDGGSPMMQRLNWQRGVAGRMYVKVEWLNMGYLADFDTSFTYVKTFSIVSDKMVSFKNKVLANARYNVPKIWPVKGETWKQYDGR